MAPTQSVFVPVDTALAQMIAQIQAAGSAITDFSALSIARTLCEAFAIVISNNSAIGDQLQLDSYLDTATGSALDALGANNWLVTRNPAVQATGVVTITRQATSGALVIPAGWGQLAATPSAPGTTGVAVQTTQDADFADGQASAAVSAQAVLGGSAGNLSIGAYLTPLAPITGVSSQSGYEVTTAFTGGVDAEADAAYRARIPITVQGRIQGRVVAFQAAALGVPGVLSVGVLGAGQTRGDGSTVPAGNVEVYYEGSAGLLSAVTSAADAAGIVNQNVLAYASVNLTAPRGQQRVVANVTVWCQSGTVTAALAAAVTSSLQAYVNSVPIGGVVYASQAVDAILATDGVASVSLPLTQFNLYGTGGSADLTMAGDSYPALAASDVTVTVNVI